MFEAAWLEIAEFVVRGSAIYLAILGLLHVRWREAGGLSMPDVLAMLVVGDAARNGFTGTCTAVLAGIVLAMMTWSVPLHFFAFRFPRFGRRRSTGPGLLHRCGAIEGCDHRRHVARVPRPVPAQLH